MDVSINFLTDAAKIVFGSAVVGFFVPAFGSSISNNIMIGGIGITILFLAVAVSLSRLKEKI